MHAGEEDHTRPGWTTSRRGQDSPWKSQSEWQTTEINGENKYMVWPTLGPRTAKEQNIHSISPLTLLSRMNMRSIRCGPLLPFYRCSVVCLCVCWSRAWTMLKRLNQSRWCWVWTSWGSRKHVPVLGEARVPTGRGSFWVACPDLLAVNILNLIR